MNHSQYEAGSNNGNYLRFMAMVGTSTAVMFGLMYLNSYALDHVLWSETRFWMTLVMGAAMALILLGFMRAMYRNSQKNMIIIGAAAAVFAGSLFLVRSQITVGDTDYMSAMVPHHSIAILTSERARRAGPPARGASWASRDGLLAVRTGDRATETHPSVRGCVRRRSPSAERAPASPVCVSWLVADGFTRWISHGPSAVLRAPPQ